MAEEQKAKLKELLNQAHTLRNSQRGIQTPKKEEINKLKDLAKQCLEISEKLQMEHGKGLSLELLGYANMMELDSNNPMDKKETIITEDQKEEIRKQYAELDSGLIEAQKIAISYEILANIYRRSDQYEKEIATIEQAVKISRTVPKVTALLDAFQRLINFLFEFHSDKADAILKFHTQPARIRTRQIHSNKKNFFIQSCRNPLNLGEQNPENFTIAGEAYDEAIFLKNNELLCAAHAHKALMLLPKIGQEEKRQMLSLLVSLENSFHPESSELRDIIDMIKQQLSGSTSS